MDMEIMTPTIVESELTGWVLTASRSERGHTRSIIIHRRESGELIAHTPKVDARIIHPNGMTKSHHRLVSAAMKHAEALEVFRKGRAT